MTVSLMLHKWQEFFRCLDDTVSLPPSLARHLPSVHVDRGGERPGSIAIEAQEGAAAEEQREGRIVMPPLFERVAGRENFCAILLSPPRTLAYGHRLLAGPGRRFVLYGADRQGAGIKTPDTPHGGRGFVTKTKE